MTHLDWSAAHRGLCVVCSEPVQSVGTPVCRACGRPAQVTVTPLEGTSPRNTGEFIADARTVCCNADVEFAPGGRITCSAKCHETFVTEVERQFGPHKVVVDQATGRRHLVPTRRIIEQGVRQDELGLFPEEPP